MKYYAVTPIIYVYAESEEEALNKVLLELGSDTFENVTWPYKAVLEMKIKTPKLKVVDE